MRRVTCAWGPAASKISSLLRLDVPSQSADTSQDATLASVTCLHFARKLDLCGAVLAIGKSVLASGKSANHC